MAHYRVNDILTRNFSTYWCKVEHDSDELTEPGVGENWPAYWGCGISAEANVATVAVTAQIAADTAFSLLEDGTGYTRSGSGNLLGSAALFNTVGKLAVFLNGIYLVKGVDVTWLSATTFKLNMIVDADDEIVVLS